MSDMSLYYQAIRDRQIEREIAREKLDCVRCGESVETDIEEETAHDLGTGRYICRACMRQQEGERQ